MERDKTFVKRRRFSEPKERIKKTNQIVLLSLTILKVFLLVGFVMQILLGREGASGVWVPAIILFLSVLADWVLYIKDHSSVELRYVMVGGFLLVYFWLNLLQHGSDFVVLYALPQLICCMLYYDRKLNKSIAISFSAVVVLRMGKELIMTKTIEQELFMVCVMTLFCLGFFAWASSVLKQFDHDAIHTLQDEQKRQQHMMTDILNVADKTRTQVEDTTDRMGNLKDSTISVNRSLKEIAQGIQSTAESIQEQTVMTGEIRDAVQVAEENTGHVVQSAQNSATKIEENAMRMEKLRVQSEEIENVGIDVEKAMEELKAKAEEVSNITKVIFSISGQTNLLALNASIESARAGEAGKGFAVVADQIRELSEQTKKSTEQIEEIVGQLNGNADITAKLIEKSLNATKEQKQLIEENAEGFDALRTESEVLSERADGLEHEVKRLLHSNNRIVENITQLSAVSEEVTASTQEASRMSENDLKELEQVADKMFHVRDTVEQLRSYHVEEESNQ